MKSPNKRYSVKIEWTTIESWLVKARTQCEAEYKVEKLRRAGKEALDYWGSNESISSRQE